VSARVRINPEAFDPWKIQAVSHSLMEHPLLQIESLVELGRRLESRKLVRTHSGEATAGSSFADAPLLHPNPKSAAETLAGIADANAWMSLLNVQADPLYRGLVDEILDELRPAIDRRDPGMCFRGGWIFVTSPGAVTPFHMDHEHNFILQVRGTKRLYTWDPFDRVVVSERAQELFHESNSRELIKWDESFRSRATIFDLQPGDGGYMPSTAPHMVENGPGPSITVSFTYYTDATRRRELLYRGNGRLRQLGIAPSPVGQSPALDGAKTAILGGVFGAQAAFKRVLGLGVRDNGVRYAPA
jgi:Cupin-like domain